MGVTAFSFIVLPLCLFWIMAPIRLLQLTFIAGVFEAAAAITVGDLGVQPGLVPALAFLGYVMLQALLGARYPGQGAALRAAQPFILVMLWAVATSFIMPRLFDDAVLVWPQKNTAPYVQAVLEPTSSNINQDIYLILNCTIMVAAALFLTRTDLQPSRVLRAYLYSGFAAAFVAVWQFGHEVFHLPFPDTLFYSNPGWAILTGQTIGRVPRINGPFSEPAALASYMVSIVCASGWAMLLGNNDKLLRPLFVTGLLTILLSTSTTGFAVLAVVSAAVTVYAILTGSTAMIARVTKIALPLLLILGFLFLGTGALMPELQANVREVLTATMNKQDSTSYMDRTSADLDSLTLTLQTFGLGAGWGSNRSSSLIPGLLAGIGVPGFCGLIWFGAGLAKRVKTLRHHAVPAAEAGAVDICCGALVGFLLAAVISAPTISTASFYLILGILIACLARAEARQAEIATRKPATSFAHSAA